jgi:glycosyltransferase involved in cell wall biosynthesis
MANWWAGAGREVTLFTFDDGSEPPFFPLHPSVRHGPLAIAKSSGSPFAAIVNNAMRIASLRRAIAKSRPDVVLSFLDTTNIVTLLATRGMRIPVVVAEHTDPSRKSIGRWEPLRRRLYPRADQVVVLSEQSLAFFPDRVRARAAIMPNPITVSPPGAPAPASGRKRLMALGRLGPEKGFDLLIDAFARIAAAHPEWDLVIWGEGPLRSRLEARRDRLGLTGRITLPGRTATPHDELRNADLFVMSSHREGFPMALGEAMACGLAAVSTDCESGPRQLIRDGVDGLLVPPGDPDALAAALSRVMGDDELRARLAARAPEVLERFGLERIMARWDELFAGLETARHGAQAGRNRTFGSAGAGPATGAGG